MVAPGQSIAYADLKALADLANQKLHPAAPLSFAAFAGTDQIALAQNLEATPNYGFGNFGPGGKVTAWLYSYKTINNVKTYSYDRAEIAVYGRNNGQLYLVDFTWDNAIDSTAPDGYVIIFPQGQPQAAGTDLSGLWNFYWQDIGNLTAFAVNDPSFTGWNQDSSYTPAAQFMRSYLDVPCAHGTWQKSLNMIFNAALFQSDVLCCNYGDVTGMTSGDAGQSGDGITIETLGIKGLVSGPWCVAAGIAPLQCWFQRPHRFLPPVSDAIVNAAQFTQCYRNIKFYYNAGDAPGGVNITAQNQLIDYQITSIAGTFLLKLVSCSTGHIKITYTGGGATIVDQDVQAGNVYDFSFASAQSLASIDVIFTTAAPGAAEAAIGISTDSILSVSVPDSYFEILTTTPVVDAINPNLIAGTFESTTCGQLTLTEQNGTRGVWVANTLPTRGIMPFVDQDLPNYKPSQFFPASSRRTPKDASQTDYQPLIDNLPANWPCFRTQDFIPDDVNGQPFLGSPAWRGSMSVPYVQTSQFENEIPVYDGADLWIDTGIFVLSGTVDIRAIAMAPGTVLYVQAGNPPTLTDFAASAPAGQWLSLKDVDPGFETDTTWYFGIYNPTKAPIANTTDIAIITSEQHPNGTFFPTIGPDDFGLVGPALEGFSYAFGNPDLFGQQLPVPLQGYSVFSITLCRLPGADMSQDLNVDVGTMQGWGWDAAGDFMAIETFTIPAGQSSITQSVFWPVIGGAPLAYESTEDVIIRAQANFQPMMHSYFVVQQEQFTFGGSPGTVTIGYFDGPPFFLSTTDIESIAVIFFGDEGFIDALGVVLPLPAALYNDVTTFLNLFG